jgi:hypothetical protein
LAYDFGQLARDPIEDTSLTRIDLPP